MLDIVGGEAGAVGTDDDGEDEQGVEISELATLWTDAIGRRV